MLHALPGGSLLIAVVAVLPGASHWWASRTLLRDLADPLLPERLLALQRRTASFAAVAIVVLFAAAFPTIAWSLPLVVLGRILGAYQLRRALYGETWSILRYLLFSLRTIVALVGFWFLLALMPVLALAAGEADWIAGGGIAIVLLLWNARNPQLILWLLNTRPLRDDALLARLRPMAEVCGVARARFAVADLRGGAVVNALAIPSIAHPAVVFSDALLARLERDEAVAIGAHELAHLEYHNPKRLRRGEVLVWTLVATGVALAPVVRLTNLPAATVITGWVIGLVALMLSLNHQRQAQETDSDRRAVELTGDAEALARGLVKIHAFSRLPRRLDGELERQSTHPSLARRLRDIRTAAAASAETLVGPISVPAQDGSTLTFEPGRLHWLEPGGAMHAVPYPQLTELRVQTSPRGLPRLIVREASGRQWDFPVAVADAERLQSTLDVVDGQLAEIKHSEGSPTVGRMVASMITITALALGHLSAALVVVLAGIRPRRPLLYAGAAACLAAAVVGARDALDGSTGLLAPLAFVPLAALLMVLGWRSGRGEWERVDSVLLTVLGVLAAAGFGALFANGIGAIGVYRTARVLGVGALLPAAFAAAFALSPFRGARMLAALPAAAALAALLAGTSWFLSTFGRDPLLVEGQRFERVVVRPENRTEFRVPFYVSDLRLSPNGRRIALISYGDGRDDTVQAFHVGVAGQPLARIAADDVVFLDDERLLLMRTEDSVTAIEALALGDDTQQVVWQTSVKGMYPFRLTGNSQTHAWAILGTSDDDEIVRVEGRIGESAARETRWAAKATTYPQAIAAAAEDAVIVEPDYDFDALAEGGFSPWSMLRFLVHGQGGIRWLRAGAQATEPLGRSQLPGSCAVTPDRADGVICFAFDGSRTRIAAIEVPSGRVSPIGWLPGRFAGVTMAPGGWAAGFANSTPVALHYPTGRLVRLEGDGIPEDARAIAATESLAAGAWHGDNESIVRVFRVEGR